VKQKLVDLWNWDGLDYLIQLGLICVFLYGAVYASSANQTLTESGCTAYWQEYNPGVNLSGKTFMSTEQARRAKKKGAPGVLVENSSINVSEQRLDIE
jgi:hypothetical protein